MRSVILLLSVITSTALAQTPLSPNAPQDQPVKGSDEQIVAFERAITPYVAKAHATYPEAKKRYLAGLPSKQVFFLTTRLYDKLGKFEQVFVEVRSVIDGQVTGIIASDINTVQGFKRGDRYTFPESDLLDWLISKPDGTEEGNIVGIFLDTYRP